MGVHSRLLPTKDGWIAVTLARQSDIESVPAWLGADVDGLDAAVRARTSTELVDQAALLGMPVAALGEAAALPPSFL